MQVQVSAVQGSAMQVSAVQVSATSRIVYAIEGVVSSPPCPLHTTPCRTNPPHTAHHP